MNNDNRNKTEKPEHSADTYNLKQTTLETSTGPDDIIDTDVDDEDTESDKTQNKLQ